MQMFKNISLVFVSNIFSLLSSIILSFAVPLVLSVEGFGYYRLYVFYLSYIGFLHFGFTDALYLKYGGIDPDKVDLKEYKSEHRAFLKYQSLVMFVVLAIAIVLNDRIVLILALTIIPTNTASCHRLFLQATGQFYIYSAFTVANTIINLGFISVLLILQISDPIYYILAVFSTSLFMCLLYEINFLRYTAGVKKSLKKINVISYNSIGIFILLGNLAVMFIFSIGRWIVQFFMGIEEFAVYSFADSMTNMIMFVVNAVGLIFYNYISKNENENMLSLIKDILVIIGVIAGAAYFILEFIVTKFLPNYVSSLDIISITFLSLPYLMVINVIIINIYKARREERKFFRVVIFSLSISVFLCVGVYYTFHSMTAIAISTLIIYITWYVYSTCKEFNYLKISRKEMIYLLFHAALFLLCGCLPFWYMSLVVYLIVIIIASFFLYKKNIFLVISMFSK